MLRPRKTHEKITDSNIMRRSADTEFLCVNVEVINTFDEEIPVGTYDFTVCWGDGEDELENLREEMADVSIMLSQLELIFGDVTEVEEYKLLRLEQRVKEDEK